MKLLCRKCGPPPRPTSYHTACPGCRGPLHFEYPPEAYAAPRTGRSLWKYRALLPVGPDTHPVTLEEGGTPLVRARFEPRADVWIKNETMNPTGSHKDRALTVGVTKAVEFGLPAIMLYSDGSTALAAAAYAARAGLRCVITFGRGATDLRLLPLMVYGAKLLEYQGTPDEAVTWVHAACAKLRLYEASTYRLANPYEAEATRTLGFEIVEQFGGAPDWIVCPVGGGGTLAGIAQALKELQSQGEIKRLPRLAAIIPQGCTALEAGLARNVSTDAELRALVPRSLPPTIQVKTGMGYPPDGIEALAGVKASGGTVLQISDEEALAAQAKLGSTEGIYCEPSSAAAIAGVRKLLDAGTIRSSERVVVVVTGSGFRETGTIAGRVALKRIPVDSENGLRTLEKVLS